MEENIKTPEYWMKEALKEAHLAENENEIPIGAVIVKNGLIIGRGHNRRERDSDLFSHAEINALKRATEFLKDWRLTGCDIYVTLEPCPMCSGAILQAKLSKVFFGAFNEKEGCGGSVVPLLDYPGLNWQTYCCGGILEDECSLILKNFALKMRK